MLENGDMPTAHRRPTPRLRELTFRFGLVVALCVVALVAGCSRNSPTGPSASSTPRPTPTQLGAPTQSPLPPPASRESAIAASNRVIQEDSATLLEIFKGKVPGNSLKAFETGAWLAYTNQFINEIGDEGDVLGAAGRPDIWLPDTTRSTTSTLANKGKTYPNAVVNLIGCFETQWDFVYKPGSPLSTPPGGPSNPASSPYSPYEVIVQYNPERRVWLITEENDLTNQPGASLCPPTS
jgi:hypothetical protein